MKEFLKKYQAIPIGFVLTYLLVKVLSYGEIIRFTGEETLFNTLGFILFALFISLAVHQYLKREGTILRIVVGFCSFLAITLTMGYFTKHTPDNPLIIFSAVIFWLVLFALILPEFFKKYKTVILGFYGIAGIYFLYVRLFSESFEHYESTYKVLALTLFLIPIPIIILLWFYDQWKWIKTMQAEKTKTELALLKSQINPHFFFNTLNNLYSLAVNKSDQTPAVILKLSDMMRHTIYEGQKDRVKLEEEIEYLRSYIDLHQIRYQKEVDITFNVTESNGLEIAPLLFIVLIENAFKHGIESQRENGFIHIELDVQDKKVMFKVENSYEEQQGQGISQGGIGLENLRKRLKHQYAGKHHLEIEKNPTSFIAKLEIDTI